MGLWRQHGPDASRAVAVLCVRQEGLRYIHQVGNAKRTHNSSLQEICFYFCVCVLCLHEWVCTTYALPTEARRGRGVPRTGATDSCELLCGPWELTQILWNHNCKLSFKALKKRNSYTLLVGILVLHRSCTKQHEIPKNIFIMWASYPHYSVQVEKNWSQQIKNSVPASLLSCSRELR